MSITLFRGRTPTAISLSFIQSGEVLIETFLIRTAVNLAQRLWSTPAFRYLTFLFKSKLIGLIERSEALRPNRGKIAAASLAIPYTETESTRFVVTSIE